MAKRKQHFIITMINLLTLIEETVALYFENHMKPVNTKRSYTDC